MALTVHSGTQCCCTEKSKDKEVIKQQNTQYVISNDF